jgi:CrcB protein
MKNYLLIFIGGGAGSLLRFFISNWFNPLMVVFPLGTLIANITSSFLLGLAVGFLQIKYPGNVYIQPLVITGICGGFSTFSTFSNETLILFQKENYTIGIANVLLNLFLCITFIIIGMKLVRSW